MRAWLTRLLVVAGGVLLVTLGLRIGAHAPGQEPLLLAVILAASGWGALLLWSLVAPRLDAVARDLEHRAEPDEPRRRVAGLRSLTRVAKAAEALEASVDAARLVSHTDALTQVANRTALIARLDSELERVRRYGIPVAVAFIDIDRFKAINDEHGHAAGDEVLCTVARLFSEHIRQSDTFGRYGGEEFLLIMPATTPIQAAETAERLRRMVARERVGIAPRSTLAVTISIGVAGGASRDITAEALIRDADAAMYSAKMLGRNQVFVFEIPGERGLVTRAPVSARMRALGRSLGREAHHVAEHRLLDAVRDLGGRDVEPTRVTDAAVGLAVGIGLADADLEALRVAVLFHDAGMAAVPGEVLAQPHALTPDEWRLVAQHPQVGHIMLEEAGRLRDASAMVLHHHERFAGHGYPHGLRGTDIPIGARILAIADAYQAMRERRPHRPALSHGDALREIARHAGTQFDPELAAVFCRVFADHEPGVEAEQLAGAG